MTTSNEFVPNAQQKQYLDQMYTTFYVLINKATGLPPNQISDDDKASDVFEKVEVYGFVLAKFHGYFNLKPDYEAYTEFEEFPTLGEAFNYIAARAMIKEGLMSEEDF